MRGGFFHAQIPSRRDSTPDVWRAASGSPVHYKSLEFVTHSAIHLTLMKSAYELAMERLNKDNPMAQLTAEQKDQISELDSKYAAKIAEKEIFLNGEIEKALQAGEIEVYESLKTQLATEKKVLQEELEEKKDRIRKG